MAETKKEFFYIAECPVPGGCSTQCWKRAAIWGWDIDDTKNRLIGHLVNSSYHQMDLCDATQLADEVEILSDTWADRFEPPPKRHRPQPPSAPPPAQELSYIKDEQVDQEETILSIVPEDHVVFSKVQFQMLADSLGRASLAVKQAARLSAAAARAFQDESANIDHAKATLESIAAKAEVGSFV
jgi:hypothetical protein